MRFKNIYIITKYYLLMQTNIVKYIFMYEVIYHLKIRKDIKMPATTLSTKHYIIETYHHGRTKKQ